MTNQQRQVLIGCAGWSIPRETQAEFPSGESHLERYAKVFRAVELNSTFYRSHLPATYARWRQSVPRGFRFSVKMPRLITHIQRLADCQKPLAAFIEEVAALGEQLGPLLVQLPPSLGFDPKRAEAFWRRLRALHNGPVVCEARHAGWFTPEAARMLVAYRIIRVAADPAPVPGSGDPGGWSGMVYYRLHGSPRMYSSSYSAAFLTMLAKRLRGLSRRGPVWCIFDNTAVGAAIPNALALQRRLAPPASSSRYQKEAVQP